MIEQNTQRYYDPDMIGRIMQYSKTRIIELTRKEMERVGLTGWHVTTSNKKSVYGITYHDEKKIEISLPLANASDEESLKETILHEIAHALCSSKVNHGKVWRETYQRIGGNLDHVDHSLDREKLNNWSRRCPNHCKKFSGVIKRTRATCPRCGEVLEYQSKKNPDKGWGAYTNFTRGTRGWLEEQITKMGATMSGNDALAPIGYIWRATETHYLICDPYYYDDQVPSSVSRSWIANDVEEGLVACHCENCMEEKLASNR